MIAGILITLTCLWFAYVSYRTIVLTKVCEQKIIYFSKTLVQKLRSHNNLIIVANLIKGAKIIDLWNNWVTEMRDYNRTTKTFGWCTIGIALIVITYRVPTMVILGFAILSILATSLALHVVNTRAKHIDTYGGVVNTVVDSVERQNAGEVLNATQQTTLDTMIECISESQFWDEVKTRGHITPTVKV